MNANILFLPCFVYEMYMQFILVVNILLCCFALGLTVISNLKPQTLEFACFSCFVHVLLVKLIVVDHTL